MKSNRPRKQISPKCHGCERRVTQVIDKIVDGKRIVRCFSCARKLGWFDDEEINWKQGRLFEE